MDRILYDNALPHERVKDLSSLDTPLIAVQCLFSPSSIINKLTRFLHFTLRSDLWTIYIYFFLLTFLVAEQHVYCYARVVLFKLLNLLRRYRELNSFPVILIFIRPLPRYALMIFFNLFVM